MIAACIFDLDGVLTDTANYHFLSWQRLAQELDITFTEADNEQLKGVSRMRSLDIILELGGKTLSEEEKQHFAAKKNEWFREFILQMTPAEVFPGVRQFLAELKEAGIKVGLGSASKNATTILTQIDLMEPFEALIDGTKVSKAKPDPEIFLVGAKALGVAPAQCVVFEDAIAGVEAAKNGGFMCVGVGKPEVLGQADHVVPGFENMTLQGLKQMFKLA